MSEESEEDTSEWYRPVERVKDPRKFPFAIICNLCCFRCNTLQEMRFHITQKCSQRSRGISLLCGHCDVQFNNWPSIVEHLNQKDMHKQSAIQPHYEMSTDIPPDMSPYLSQSETLQYHRQQVQRRSYFRPQDAPPPEDLLAVATRTAGISTVATGIVNQTREADQPGLVLPNPAVVPFLEDETDYPDMAQMPGEVVGTTPAREPLGPPLDLPPDYPQADPLATEITGGADNTPQPAEPIFELAVPQSQSQSVPPDDNAQPDVPVSGLLLPTLPLEEEIDPLVPPPPFPSQSTDEAEVPPLPLNWDDAPPLPADQPTAEVELPVPPPDSSLSRRPTRGRPRIHDTVIDLTSDVDENDNQPTRPEPEGGHESKVKLEPKTDQAAVEGCSASTLEAQLRLAQSIIERQQREINSLKRNENALLRQARYLAGSVHLLGRCADLPASPSERRKRQRMIDAGAWPSNLRNAPQLSYSALGEKLRDFYHDELVRHEREET